LKAMTSASVVTAPDPDPDLAGPRAAAGGLR